MSDLNPVRLRAENIDLKEKLNAVSSQVAGLQLALTQANAANRDDDNTISIKEYEELEAELQSSMDRERKYCEHVETLNAQVEKLERKAKTMEAENRSLKLTHATAHADPAEVAALKKEVEELKKREADLTEVINELELSLQLAGEGDSPAKASPSHGKGSVRASTLERAKSQTTADWETTSKMTEAEMKAEIERRVEEAVVGATIDLEMQLEEAQLALKEQGGSGDVSKLKEQVTKLTEERDNAKLEAERASAEKNIAVRVKEGALQECSTARVELERLRKELKRASSGQATSAESSQEATAELAKQLQTVRQEYDRTIVQHTGLLADKEQEINELQAKLHGIEEREELATEDAANAWAQVEELKSQLNSTRAELDNTSQQRDLAIAAGRQLDAMRQRATEDKEARHQEQIQRLHSMQNMQAARLASRQQRASAAASVPPGVRPTNHHLDANSSAAARSAGNPSSSGANDGAGSGAGGSPSPGSGGGVSSNIWATGAQTAGDINITLPTDPSRSTPNRSTSDGAAVGSNSNSSFGGLSPSPGGTHHHHQPVLSEAVVKEIFQSVVSRYELLLEELAAAGDNEDAKEEKMYDALFDYERRIWHQNNDLKSMRAIVDIRVKDKDQEFAREREALQSRVEILRMQIKDLGKDPNC